MKATAKWKRKRRRASGLSPAKSACAEAHSARMSAALRRAAAGAVAATKSKHPASRSPLSAPAVGGGGGGGSKPPSQPPKRCRHGTSTLRGAWASRAPPTVAVAAKEHRKRPRVRSQICSTSSSAARPLSDRFSSGTGGVVRPSGRAAELTQRDTATCGIVRPEKVRSWSSRSARARDVPWALSSLPIGTLLAACEMNFKMLLSSLAVRRLRMGPVSAARCLTRGATVATLCTCSSAGTCRVGTRRERGPTQEDVRSMPRHISELDGGDLFLMTKTAGGSLPAARERLRREIMHADGVDYEEALARGARSAKSIHTTRVRHHRARHTPGRPAGAPRRPSRRPAHPRERRQECALL